MLFVVLLLSWLAVQLWRDIAPLQQDSWLPAWRRWVDKNCSDLFGETVAMIILLLLPVLAVGLLLQFFGDWFFGLLGLLINMVAVLYACGRDDPFEALSAYRRSLSEGFPAARRTAEQYYGVTANSFSDLHRAVWHCASYGSYERWFAAVFWFVLLGAPAAVFYRICLLSSQRNEGEDAVGTPDSRAEKIEQIIYWLDWFPSRCWAFLYALAADFSTVYPLLKEGLVEVIGARQLLARVSIAASGAAAEQALDSHDPALAADALAGLESLLLRVMIAGLVAAAIFTIFL